MVRGEGRRNGKKRTTCFTMQVMLIWRIIPCIHVLRVNVRCKWLRLYHAIWCNPCEDGRHEDNALHAQTHPLPSSHSALFLVSFLSPPLSLPPLFPSISDRCQGGLAPPPRPPSPLPRQQGHGAAHRCEGWSGPHCRAESDPLFRAAAAAASSTGGWGGEPWVNGFESRIQEAWGGGRVARHLWLCYAVWATERKADTASLLPYCCSLAIASFCFLPLKQVAAHHTPMVTHRGPVTLSLLPSLLPLPHPPPHPTTPPSCKCTWRSLQCWCHRRCLSSSSPTPTQQASW